ncbi:hypothetical protein WJX72_011875 [[Myrmecia] bisecta]|uniref:NADH dehydrogenase [ubiquinone] iron-sulfur protein 5 n=1 Tax=[Myrmecia] bisecta TaxID=41462 RepID=A0AAW1PHD2_9CHLO
MASGFGLTGSTGRCFPLWMDFSECMSTAEEPAKCKDLRDDYLECLHHRKEFTRLNMIYKEKQRKLKEGDLPHEHDKH